MAGSNPSRMLIAIAAIGLTLALATVAAAQTPLGPPDAPPVPEQPAAPSTPAPSTPAPSTPAPSTPAPSSPAPSSPAPSTPAPSSPSSEPAEPTPSAAAAAAERRRQLQQRRAAARARARERQAQAAILRARLEAAEGRQTVRATVSLAGRVTAVSSTVTRATRAAVAKAPRETTPTQSDDKGTGQMLMLALLVAAALGIGLVVCSWIAGRPSALERFRFEVVGISLTCVLIAALVLAGIV